MVRLLNIVWVTPGLRARGLAAFRGARLRRLSLVDYVSFEVMRDPGITDVFTFDSDFARQGFRIIP